MSRGRRRHQIQEVNSTKRKQLGDMADTNYTDETGGGQNKKHKTKAGLTQRNIHNRFDTKHPTYGDKTEQT